MLLVKVVSLLLVHWPRSIPYAWLIATPYRACSKRVGEIRWDHRTNNLDNLLISKGIMSLLDD
jgi:hypothetical protein